MEVADQDSSRISFSIPIYSSYRTNAWPVASYSSSSSREGFRARAQGFAPVSIGPELFHLPCVLQ